MTLAPGGSPQGTTFYDTEGVTYIGNEEFVITEERDRQLVKFKYVAGGELTRAAAKTVKLGTTIGDIGLEGVTNDPITGGFIVTKEQEPEGIFQTNIDWEAGTATNGSPTTVESTNLFPPAARAAGGEGGQAQRRAAAERRGHRLPVGSGAWPRAPAPR
jgi:uncharacterized protein YjiK